MDIVSEENGGILEEKEGEGEERQSERYALNITRVRNAEYCNEL